MHNERERRAWRNALTQQYVNVAEIMGIDEFNKMMIPELIELRDQGLLSADHPVNELLDRWDPETESLRDAK